MLTFFIAALGTQHCGCGGPEGRKKKERSSTVVALRPS